MSCGSQYKERLTCWRESATKSLHLFLLEKNSEESTEEQSQKDV
jgi:hypothetical protein